MSHNFMSMSVTQIRGRVTFHLIISSSYASTLIELNTMLRREAGCWGSEFWSTTDSAEPCCSGKAVSITVGTNASEQFGTTTTGNIVFSVLFY